jgi:hypothetical protein
MKRSQARYLGVPYGGFLEYIHFCQVWTLGRNFRPGFLEYIHYCQVSNFRPVSTGDQTFINKEENRNKIGNGS